MENYFAELYAFGYRELFNRAMRRCGNSVAWVIKDHPKELYWMKEFFSDVM